jgi:rRNA maturation endonuclease Nob1
MKCTGCGYEFDKAKFCPECGKPAPFGDKTICKRCNYEIDSNVKFCPECGEPVRINYEGEDKRDKDKRVRRRDDDEDEDEGGILGGIGDLVGKIFKG